MKCENSPEKPCGELIVESESYTMKQLHFHSPSEYTVAGEQFPLEAHFVHKSTCGSEFIAVASVFFKLGEGNSDVAKIFAAAKTRGETEVDLSSLYDGSAGTFSFDGSLTTPPCSEGVEWVVSRSIMEISQAQADEYLSFVGGTTNRPIQPINSRNITCSNKIVR
jgi:carbonic anhydrase